MIQSGYLKVNGINIEYIVVQGQDNEYYLQHDFQKRDNKSGWIFADCRNRFDGTDKNMIIYGHNMKNGQMFSNLKVILTEEWNEETQDKDIVFITKNSIKADRYKIFSAYEIKDENEYLKTSFEENEFEEYIEKMKRRSKYDYGIDIKYEDHIITLSTCSNSNKNRIIVHAKKID